MVWKKHIIKYLSGKKGYETSGKVFYDNENLLELMRRAHKGLFLAFQYPLEIPELNNNF